MEGAGFTDSDESVGGGLSVPRFFCSLTRRRRSTHHHGPSKLAKLHFKEA